ncbi:MAG TPA: ribbon-helix-helix protein, CopG family [Candidatus Lokiarchaeia archaeon]|nr:ribbon-helix-helix protein, CopG family [Candidatus Lokiarchaeia archaeon]
MSADEEKKMKSEIISISLSKALLDKIDTIQEDRKFASRSEVIRHCLQTYSKDLEETSRVDESVGIYIIGISYYSAKTKPGDIQDIIKDFTHDILSSNRIKISQSINILLYIMKTNINMASIFFEKLSAIKGLIDKKLFSLKVSV